MNRRLTTKGVVEYVKRLNSRIVVAVTAFCVVGVLLATPRPTVPHLLPLPTYDMAAARVLERKEYERARHVMDGSLPNSIRAVGESVRRCGSQLAKASTVDGRVLAELRDDVRILLKREQIELLADLRALQAELFIEAVHQALHDGKSNHELDELGGEFSRMMFEAWYDESGRTLVLDDDQLRLMFRIHFNRLTGLDDHSAFRQTLQELRRYYGTLIEHPYARARDPMSATLAQMNYAKALDALDPHYDARPLLGILHIRLGQPGHAIEIFDRYLAERPEAPFSSLVRHHQKWALLQASAMLESGF